MNNKEGEEIFKQAITLFNEENYEESYWLCLSNIHTYHNYQYSAYPWKFKQLGSWKKILLHLEEKARAGNVICQYEFYNTTRNKTSEGPRGPNDPNFSWCVSSANLGCANAQYDMAWVHFYLNHDNKAAIPWLQKAAQQNLAFAQSKLAECYWALKNYEEAFLWANRAVRNDEPGGYHTMGRYHELKKDTITAREIYEVGFFKHENFECALKLEDIYRNALRESLDLRESRELLVNNLLEIIHFIGYTCDNVIEYEKDLLSIYEEFKLLIDFQAELRYVFNLKKSCDKLEEKFANMALKCVLITSPEIFNKMFNKFDHDSLSMVNDACSYLPVAIVTVITGYLFYPSYYPFN
jgi:hypothetical protein